MKRGLYGKKTIQKETTQEGIAQKRDYTISIQGKDYIEKKLYRKKTIRGKDYTGRKHKGSDYIGETKIDKRGITQERDYTGKNYRRRATLHKEWTI